MKLCLSELSGNILDYCETIPLVYRLMCHGIFVVRDLFIGKLLNVLLLLLFIVLNVYFVSK